jgi:branched-chain amino acid transport system substrate-binding protein
MKTHGTIYSQRLATRRAFWLAGFLLAAILLSACQSKRPVKIGITTELTGRNATLGVQGRNGALLAMDGINDTGGVGGRPLEALVMDDAGDADRVAQANQAQVRAGALALFGYMTSLEAVAARDFISENDIVLFSPTASSPDFSGQKDNFFRLIPVNTYQAIPLAVYAYQTLGLRRAALLHDHDNTAFAHPLSETFRQVFLDLGGEVIADIHFSSSSNPDFAAVVTELRHFDPEGVLIVASSVDTALIAQEMSQQNWSPQLLTANWAYTADLLHNGGKAIEGILIASHHDNNCQTPAYLKFKAAFEQKYGEPPTFAAVLAYESMHVLADALEATGGSAEGLPAALAARGEVKGLCDTIYLDEYGDAWRSLFLITIEDGQFGLVATIPAQPPQ